jgi:predicted ATP-grasp superfamily ATP-dependent carboligase
MAVPLQIVHMNQQTERAVVVPTGISVKSLGCVRSLGRRGIRTVIVSEFESVPACYSQYCDEEVMVPSPHEDLIAYKDALLDIAARQDVGAIIPTREEDAYLLSKHRQEFAEHVALGWPSFDSLQTVHDGYRLAQHAADVGIPVPETRLLTDVEDWSPELIVKQRYSILTPDYADFLSPKECEGGGQEPIYLESGVEPDTDAIVESMLGQVPVVQSVVRGTEYSVRALYDNGTPVATSLRRQIRGRTYAGGASVFREMTHDPAVEELGMRLLDSLDWHGLATVQFMKNEETGEATLIEINPRIWSSIMLDMHAGADYPYHYWLMTNGESARIDPSYRSGVATHLLLGELQYLRSVLRDDFPNVPRPTFGQALLDVGRSVFRHPHFDIVSLDDPSPFVRSVIDALSP